MKEVERLVVYIEDFGPHLSETILRGRHHMTDLIDRIVSGLTVQEADAKQDRIQLKLKRWTFQGTPYQFETFSTRLSRTFLWDGVQRRLFNAQQGDERRAIWPISGGTGSRRYTTPPGVPLFSGRLRGYQQPSRQDQPTKTWHLIAELSLNPTRAMLHEGALDILPRLTNTDAKSAIPATLFARARPRLETLPFISGDNFETGSQRLRSLFRQPNWDINVWRYWEGVVRLLDHTLQTAADDARGDIYNRIDHKLTFQTIETYWEFKDTDPLATVAALERPFRSLGSKSSVEWYALPAATKPPRRNRGVILADDDNAPVIKIHVAKGVQIKAYAKTTERVRFEVTHSQGAADIGSYTADGKDGLYSWIDRAAQGAAQRMNQMLGALGQVLSDPLGYQYLPQRLLFDLYEVYKDWPLALRTLSMLITTGKIEARKSSPLGDEVKKLIRKKIIRRVSPKNADVRIFHVTERYRAALASFQSTNSG